MPILFDKNNKTFQLNTKTSSYIIKVFEEGYLLNLYYGAPIPETYISGRECRRGSVSFSPSNPFVKTPGFRPDTAPMEYGCNGAGDFRISALAVRNQNGDSVTDVRYMGHRIYDGKPEIPGMPSTYANTQDEAQTLEIDALDVVTGVKVTLYYTVFADLGVMTRRVRVTNTSEAALRVERVFSLCVDLPTMDYDLITLYGRHGKERSIERRKLAHGLQGVESKRGASGHCQNPFAALVQHGADEEHGWCYGFNLVYSGNFSALAECDYNCSTRFVMGINPVDFSWKLEPNESFDAPETVMVFTEEGIGEMSRIFHRFYNRNLIRGRWKTEKRPLLINSWEAAYFDFDTDTLIEYARCAKELGIEMLVMDDGWFGRRNDDKSSLGDWFVNEEKLPGGLGTLVSEVHKLGLKFGIWYEPEMVSPNSQLFREHPDWHIHVPGRTPMIGRSQYVLDMSREDVRENIWQQMYAVLSKYEIDYVKWDFNRNLSDAASVLLPADRQTEFFHRYVLGVYDLMNRLVTTFPDILLENCSGGGGRFDPGMLYYSPQIWESDVSDPIERLYSQFGTSLCYPASTMGAHVSKNPRAGIATRGDVALWGTFGYELDPRKLTDEQKTLVKSQVAEYHAYYDLIRYGDLYRLVYPQENAFRAVWQIVSQDKSAALLTMVTMRAEGYPNVTVKLRGLDPQKRYLCQQTGEVLSGAAWMHAGVILTDMASSDGESVKLYFCAAEN